MSEALSSADRETLLVERAEAEAQLRAAEATLGISASNVNGRTDVEQEREEPAQNPHNMEAQDGSVADLDVEALRAAAARAREADDELARAASEAAERPLSSETELGTTESGFARALEIQDELPAAWRRLVGALISATGMAIVIGALGWNVYWLLVPIALIAILTVDLRLAGKSAREASTEAAHELASVGVVGADGLDRIRHQRTMVDEREARLEAARAERDAAYAVFEELAPDRLPSEVDELIAEYEAERAARAQARTEAEAARAKADAEAEAARERAEAEARERTEAEARERAEAQAQAAQAEAQAAQAEAQAAQAEAQAAQAEADAEEAQAEAKEAPAEAPQPVTASEWWFGTKEAPAVPPAAAPPVRALAERLSAEGREALARIQAQLDALDRVELAKKSLEWHEANGSAEPADTSQEKA